MQTLPTLGNQRRQFREFEVEKRLAITLKQRLADPAGVDLGGAFAEKARKNGGSEW